MPKMDDFYPLILEAFDQGLTFTFPVRGTSMRPLLKSGDLVTLKKPEGRLKKGDIPLFLRPDGHFVLHRVRRVHEESYDIVGDHQYALERNVLDSQIIGVVISYTKKGEEKVHTMHNFRYRLYTQLVKIGLLRRVFGKVYK